MKKYEFSVTIEEGNDEFWESIEKNSGCDEVQELLQDAFISYGIDNITSIKLIKFENI